MFKRAIRALTAIACFCIACGNITAGLAAHIETSTSTEALLVKRLFAHFLTSGSGAARDLVILRNYYVKNGSPGKIHEVIAELLRSPVTSCGTYWRGMQRVNLNLTSELLRQNETALADETFKYGAGAFPDHNEPVPAIHGEPIEDHVGAGELAGFTCYKREQLSQLSKIGKPFELRINFGRLDPSFKEADLSAIAGFDKIHSLQIRARRHSQITDASLVIASTLPNLSTLKLECYAEENKRPVKCQLRSWANMNGLRKLTLDKGTIDDQSLHGVAQCKSLEELTISDERITDSGLPALRELPNLRVLNLWGTAITESGLGSIAEIYTLQKVTVPYRLLTDAGVKQLARLKNLRELRLYHSSVTDAGLAPLADLKQLHELFVEADGISGDGFAHLSELPQLSFIFVEGKSLNDNAFQALSTIPALERLYIKSPLISTNGLQRLKDCKNLQQVQFYISSSRMPLLDQNRQTDDWLLTYGQLKSLRQFPSTVPLKDLAKLNGLVNLESLEVDCSTGEANADTFRNFKSLKRLSLQRASDTVLASLKGLESLQELELELDVENHFIIFGKVTDRGIAELGDLPRLERIEASHQDITGAGFAGTGKFTHLQKLYLGGCHVDDAGLKNIADLPSLKCLDLGGTKVTSAGVNSLRLPEKWTSLDLSSTRIDDASEHTLAGLKNIEKLDLRGTDLSIATLSNLERILPNRSMTPAPSLMARILRNGKGL